MADRPSPTRSDDADPQHATPSDPETRPHPLANDMVDSEDLEPTSPHEADPEVSERREAALKLRHYAGLIVLFILVGLVFGFIFFRNDPVWFALTVLFVTLFMTGVIFPIAMARMSKIHTDETVRSHRAQRAARQGG